MVGVNCRLDRIKNDLEMGSWACLWKTALNALTAVGRPVHWVWRHPLVGPWTPRGKGH